MSKEKVIITLTEQEARDVFSILNLGEMPSNQTTRNRLSMLYAKLANQLKIDL